MAVPWKPPSAGNAPERSKEARSFTLSYAGSFKLVVPKKVKTESAELLTEKVYERKSSWVVRAAVKWSVVVTALIIVILVVSFFMLFPTFARRLPNTLASPNQNYVAYQRIVKGSVDYFPTIPSKQRLGLADLGQGVSLAFILSADVVSNKGTQGVIRMEIDNPEQVVVRPDVIAHYTMIWPQDASQGVTTYLRISEWPEVFNDIFPARLVRDSWLVYDTKQSSIQHEGLTKLLYSLQAGKDEATKELMRRVWLHAVKTGALQLEVDRLVRMNTNKKWVTDLKVTAAPDRLGALVDSLKSDPAYQEPFPNGSLGVGSSSLLELLGSLHSASGKVSIGLFDRMLYDSNWEFDLFHPATGSIRGNVTASFYPSKQPVVLETPAETKELTDVLALVALLSEPDNSEDEGQDTDEDRLADTEEERYGTDPSNKDTDGDGYLDGDEVAAGFNPRGGGLLSTSTSELVN